MALPISMRNMMLYGVLALTLSAVAWLQMRDQPVADDVQLAPSHRHSAQASTSEPGLAAVHPSAVDQPADDAEKSEDAKNIDLFSAHAWYVPPPPPPKRVAPEPPPKPTAPPVPFVYMGEMEGTPQGTLVFLSANNKLYSVAKGEVIDRVWRLDGEDANTLRLTYMPLSLQQTLSKSARPVPKQNEDTPNERGIPG